MSNKHTRTFGRILAATCAIALSFGLAACESNSGNSKSSDTSAGTQMAGVKATGALGKKPKITFHTPMSVVNNSYVVLQKGNGPAIQKNNHVCIQGIALNAKDGSEMMSTWEKNTPDCSMVMNEDGTGKTYYNVLKDQKINSTVAFGINDHNKNSTSYIMAITLVSQSKPITRAEGTKVTDVPANLPKVTLGEKGAPSIDFNGYKPGNDLVVQPLIKGKGKKVAATDTIDAHYTGWVMDKDGKPSKFDSSWDRGKSSQFSLQQVVDGWKKGLAGQTVGSQVLLVVPPDLGYGKTAQAKIPANSTLYFVVDILYDYGQMQGQQ
ncbi:FKBP-type peptidyl-prolyl cis-trans isomerase [Bifidobacterium sp. ESL0798]|uniref:FKBP-type peptidyl-prolyl cis-trans isomerase n=1 Tax=unclassified Bifidobacterium TaxID=2608897 RepID=UPI0023F9A50B|nr:MULTISPECIES: FKBP-type peptidyl-prolyl cis-trans isomerase [unclassified Bifidobacterium]WEV52758.1 FKBP-type peptidyl-prolyl cis-trans isomerase [Bifidobacterium sp. ESL0704]WEV74253.1 FKBP-type peptidyl-prolyl cis-trans isomerase [Bifidobacterium sp. ESL0798]